MPLARNLAITATSLAVAATAFFTHVPQADACGCFVPPDVSVPIVQAGERILFAMENGEVTAHIQIQYSGEPEEFGWLVPLPSIPEMEVGTDELFNQLIATTQPLYRLNRQYLGECPFDPSRNGGPLASGQADDASAPGAGGGEGAPPPSPLVLRDTVGPYDYAVLNAESKQPMLDWLEDNGFFVPTGTEDVVDPYIRPGGYFLALKLLNGNSAGDLQPIVLRYQSELPMIPIVLTSVAADPDMGIMVWVLGEHRAIPRNYYHTRINDALINWLDWGSNYVSVINRAVDESDTHQSFVTEYAGSSNVMVDRLDAPGRFGDLVLLRQLTDAISYLEYMTYNGFATPTPQSPFSGLAFSGQVLTILDRHLPVPSALIEQGYTPSEYYTAIAYFLGPFKDQNPELFADLDTTFDPVMLTDELEERVVEPTLAAGKLFRDHPYMSRLFTTLSPEEMTRDPVFSFNPDLDDVSNVHEATIIYDCTYIKNRPQGETPARLVTEQGWVLRMPDGEDNYDWPDADMPASMFTEILREEGPALGVSDNSSLIEKAIDEHSGRGGFLGFGCAVGSRDGMSGLGALLIGMFGVALWRRRRRQV